MIRLVINMNDRSFYWDEDVLRIQNEVRRHNEQRIYDSDVNDQVQRSDSSGSDSDFVSDKSRSDLLQNSSTAVKRK